jgi:PKD repeat protein
MSKPPIEKSLALFLLLLCTPILVNHTFALSPLRVTVKTDKTSYQLREKVSIYGNVTYNDIHVEEGLAAIQIRTPLGMNITRTSLLGPIGTQNFDIQILLLTLCDENGNPQQTVIRGRNAYFRVQIKNNGLSSRKVIATATIYDNETIPIGSISREKDEFLPGGILDFWQSVYIDPWVKNGTATICASVFSDWPEENGYPYCPERVATFAILESEYDETTPTQAPEQFIQNGSYVIEFRLSPEPQPGTYVVSATAWYRGWKTDLPITTTFEVIDIEAPPRASFVIKPPVAGPGYSIQFDASSSSAEGYNDSIVSYSWDFGDGQKSTGKITSHSYSTTSTYIVTLNVTDAEGFWNTTSRILIIAIMHDVAVKEIQSMNNPYNDWNVQVKVKVKNLGTVNETFNVTLYVNNTFIGKNQVSSLGPFLTTTLTFTWNTTGLTPLKNYTLQAIADILPDEINMTDNILEYGPIFTRLLGDASFDRKIDILDLVIVTSIYGSTSNSPNWNIMADLAPDGKIDILDVVKVTSIYGTTY